jgi:hypothetical protein
MYAVGGGSGIANALNDGGMAQCVEFEADRECNWREVGDLYSSRGAERPLGRGQLMGASVACGTWSVTMRIAVGSPRDGLGDAGAGSVTVWSPSPEQWKLPDWQSMQSVYHGRKRGFRVGASLVWWVDGGDRIANGQAVLIGAPGEDSPSGQLEAGAVWVVWHE